MKTLICVIMLLASTASFADKYMDDFNHKRELEERLDELERREKANAARPSYEKRRRDNMRRMPH